MTASVDVVNRTRVPVDCSAVATLVEGVLTAEGAAGAEVGVTFVGDGRIRALNRDYRGRDEVTDVLSFPLEDPDEGAGGGVAGDGAAAAGLPRLLGDVVIGARQALRQARADDLPPSAELAVLLVHGVLHLLGHDHETDAGQMALRQAELLEHVSWEELVGHPAR